MTLRMNPNDFGVRRYKGEAWGGVNPQCGFRALSSERVKMEHLYFTGVWIWPLERTLLILVGVGRKGGPGGELTPNVDSVL